MVGTDHMQGEGGMTWRSQMWAPEPTTWIAHGSTTYYLGDLDKLLTLSVP